MDSFSRSALGHPRILELPYELQIRCLSYLTAIELLRSRAVCRKWKQLGYDGLLWIKVDITSYDRSIPVEQLTRMTVAGGRFLRVANLRGCVQLTGYNLRTLADHCPNIEVLSLKDCRSLSTHSIAYFLTQIKQHGKLRSLDLSGLDTVRNTTLVQIGNLSSLEHLDLSWCSNLTIGGSDGCPRLGFEAIATGCPKLTHLRLNGCSSSVALHPATMAVFGQYLTSLAVLSLASCTGLTDAALSALFHPRLLRRLTKLNLSGCNRLTDVSLRSIALAAPPLTHLQLSDCVLLSDRGLCFLAVRLPLLTHLDLENLPQITNTAVKSLATHQSYLTYVGLTNCIQVGDDGIIELALHGAARDRLRHLELDNSMISDTCLETIADAMTILREKDATVTADSVVATSDDPFSTTNRGRPSLIIEALDCRNITEAGVRDALSKAGDVLAIKSFYSWKFNNGGERDRLTELTSRTLSDNTQVREDARQQEQPLIARRRHCTIL
ncbi:hypothetical protein BX666DRAFT_1869551 [Dichotomocladium elegans]|nr:hypothetical protein BX666DRAFT_1869551 [Dichotomocladium elegans]